MAKKKKIKGFFKDFTKKIKSNYTSKITTPIYETTSKQPSLYQLTDKRKYRKLLKQIEQSSISEKEKDFLISAASRHIIFDYSDIAEYYCHASKEMQELMEKSALIIIDFNQAYEDGYVQIARDVAEQYLETYGE